MEIKSNITPAGGVYEVQIDIVKVTAHEQEYIAAFGAPLVAFGGAFTTVGGTAFTLASNDRRVPDELPVRESFDSTSDTNANAKAIAWRDTVMGRISQAISDLLLRSLGETGTKVQDSSATPGNRAADPLTVQEWMDIDFL